METARMRQLAVEHELMAHITRALRGTMDWSEDGEGLGPKLATIRFVVESFRRHFEHLIELEERHGYFEMLAGGDVDSCREIDRLESEHGRFRDSLRSIVYRLQHVSATRPAEFAAICQDLRNLLDEIDEHCLRETYLAQAGLISG